MNLNAVYHILYVQYTIYRIQYTVYYKLYTIYHVPFLYNYNIYLL